PRLADVARQAGAPRRKIYLYLKTKGHILVRLSREKMAEWVAFLREAIADLPDAVAKLPRLVALHLKMLEDNPALAEVLQVELRQGHKFFRGASAHEITAYFALIRAVLEEGMAAGLL